MKNDELKKLTVYYKEIEKRLICSAEEKKSIINNLKYDVEDFLEVDPNAGIKEVKQRFGTPEAFVAEYLANFEEKEVYHKVSKAKKLKKWIILAIIATIIIVAIGVIIMVLDNHGHVVHHYYEYITEP